MPGAALTGAAVTSLTRLPRGLCCLLPAFLPAWHRVLLQAYAAHLQPEWFSEAAYLWAVELWYAYAMQVRWCGCSRGRACCAACGLWQRMPLAQLCWHDLARLLCVLQQGSQPDWRPLCCA